MNGEKMKNSKIGEYGFRLIPIERHKTKKGKIIAPYWKKVKFGWKHN
jgi:hypothetical protein